MLSPRQDLARGAAEAPLAHATASTTMQAIVFDAYGPPQTLRMAALPMPEAGPGEVRISVRAVGVQPIDCALRGGWFAQRGIGMASLPRQLGSEFSGVVDQVGAGVSGIASGDEVLGWSAGKAYAEAVVVPASQLVAKPPLMSWAVAGALAACGQTAYHAVQTLDIAVGDTVLVHGAAAGVGAIATQLARLHGARVLATAGTEHHDYLRSLGAEPLLPSPDLITRIRAMAPHGVRAALDASGKGALDTSIALGVERSRIVSLVAYEDVQANGVRDIRRQRSRECLARLVALFEAGMLRLHIRDIYPLAQAALAHRDVESGNGRGKVVLMVYRAYRPMP